MGGSLLLMWRGPHGKELRVASGSQEQSLSAKSARKERLQSYHCKELKTANKLEFGGRFFPGASR